ncbi:hypothetical protein AKJ09_03339 [Labilithrix luteola]|uniref:Uncharacterized protein n=1 Tax=Labilithrix luteola TaxID=1391654 RepID=A0A0K1PT03_9BACT|nr:hypothetical protein AKJ09_03339 [Labilithrix luteola]
MAARTYCSQAAASLGVSVGRFEGRFSGEDGGPHVGRGRVDG